MRRRSLVTRTRDIVACGLIITMMPSAAHAHGLYVFASTPVTPPRGCWLLVSVFFVIVTITWDWLVLAGNISAFEFIRREIAGFVVFTTVFLGIGAVMANVNTGPPPGLGLPHRPLYGMSFLRAGSIFIFFNVIGLVIFRFARKFFLTSLEGLDVAARRRLSRVGVWSYTLMLIPYVAVNAMTHGWAGGFYVEMNCYYRLISLGEGIARYAHAHNGRMPDVASTRELVKAIKRYDNELTGSLYRGKAICPVEEVYKRNARPYEWNTAFAGAMLDACTNERNAGSVLRCPTVYKEHSTRALHMMDLLKIQTVLLLGEERKRAEDISIQQPAAIQSSALSRTSRTYRSSLTLPDHARNGNAAEIEALLASGASPEVRDENAWTALMHAADRGHEDIARILLDKGADVNAKDFGRHTAVMLAAWRGHSTIVQALLEKGAEADACDILGWTALMHAAWNGNIDTIEALLDAGTRDRGRPLSDHDWSALMIAANRGHVNAVNVLISRTGNPNEATFEGRTALMVAAANGQADSVRALLDHGANALARDDDGRTAMWYAQQGGHENVIELLKNEAVKKG